MQFLHGQVDQFTCTYAHKIFHLIVRMQLRLKIVVRCAQFNMKINVELYKITSIYFRNKFKIIALWTINLWFFEVRICIPI